jgi:hypothetical protein
VALSWIDENNSNSDFTTQLPYSVLSNATQNFVANNRIGGGGSCLVFKGNVYGIAVAIKALQAKKAKRDDER